jgi:hypothetical protein
MIVCPDDETDGQNENVAAYCSNLICELTWALS